MPEASPSTPRAEELKVFMSLPSALSGDVHECL